MPRSRSSSPSASTASASAPAATVSLGGPTHPLDTPELLVAILGDLDQRSLGRTSRVNKLWLDASTRARMGHVIVEDQGVTALELSWLIAQLSQRPELGAYVKDLTLGGNFFTEGEGAIFAQLALSRLLDLCPAIERVLLFDAHSPAQVNELAYELSLRYPHMVSLTLFSEWDDTRGMTLAPALRSLVNLKHLELPTFFLVECDLSLMGSPPDLRLESFVVGDEAESADTGSVEVLDWFLGSSRHSLKTLWDLYGYCTPEVASWIFNNLKQLENVKVEVTGEGDFASWDATLQLLELPKLTSIRLIFWEQERRPGWNFDLDITFTGYGPHIILEESPPEVMVRVRTLLGLDDE